MAASVARAADDKRNSRLFIKLILLQKTRHDVCNSSMQADAEEPYERTM
jgi:hypothetical protein